LLTYMLASEKMPTRQNYIIFICYLC